MKLSVSLPGEDVEFLDEYAKQQGYASRSAVLHQAVRLLRATDLTDDYERAWDEWKRSGDQQLWESTTSDALGA